MTSGIKRTGEGYFTTAGRIKTDAFRATPDAPRTGSTKQADSDDAAQVQLREVGGTFQTSLFNLKATPPEAPQASQPPAEQSPPLPSTQPAPLPKNRGRGNGRKARTL